MKINNYNIYLNDCECKQIEEKINEQIIDPNKSYVENYIDNIYNIINMKSRKNELYYYNIVNYIIKNEFVDVLEDYIKHWKKPKKNDFVNEDTRDDIKLIINAINNNDLHKFIMDMCTTSFYYDNLKITLQFCDDCTFLYLNDEDMALLSRNHNKIFNLHIKIIQYFNDILKVQ